MSEETIVKDRPNSVKYSINAKGLWSGEVKVYAETAQEAMKEALLKAELMADLIKAKNRSDVL